METQQAKELIEKTFTEKFDLVQYTQSFLSNLLNRYDDTKERGWSAGQIYQDFKEHVAAYKRVGLYTDPDGEEIELLVVRVKSFAKLERARTSLRNYVVKWLQSDDNKERARDYALVAFYSDEDKGQEDWRFSFIKLETEFRLNEKGRTTRETVLSPAKRYSYLVGLHEKSHTAQKQLLPLLERDFANPTLAEIEEAFSVEKVTDEFFKQYKELYDKLKKHLDDDTASQEILTDAGLDSSRFAKKLLGQVVFLYFVQKKGWLGVQRDKKWGSGHRFFLREIFEKTANKGQSFYADDLQYLFYEALAQERNGSWYERFNCHIPFLNGGLFEANYDWKSQPIHLPNELFGNDTINNAGDQGTGILDVFDRYNFTIKEDEPLEKEVAVDPEMLGKVFENMLETEERKGKGAFYTPREIVHYMCQESLIHYLDNSLNSYPTLYQEIDSPQVGFLGNKERTGQLKMTTEEPSIQVSKEDLETFIRLGPRIVENDARVVRKGEATKVYPQLTPDSIIQHAREIDRLLASIKICDPAIGSGAFPVGLLNEIVVARSLLTIHFDGYPVEKQGEKLDYYTRVDAWLLEKHRTLYNLKRHAIQESIYGVDIDASAIDIARLRLWLSLIVDEDNFDQIDALPNLDYKIVQGDSLVGFPPKSMSSQSWGTGLKEIEALKQQFFIETTHEKKQLLKSEIDEKIEQRLANTKRAFGYQIRFDFGLFFSEIWSGENGGFDIVIGNPPYVQIQTFSGQQIQKDWEKQEYNSFAKTGDLYCLFYEKGYRLLRNQGLLAFITSNKWMRAGYGKKMRQFLLNHTAIEQLIDFGDSPIFTEATTYTNILLFEKGANKSAIPKAWDLSSAYRKATSLDQMLTASPVGVPVMMDDAFIIIPPEFARIKERIEHVGTPLKQWDITINYGIKTGFNEAFIIDGQKKDELIAQDPKSAEILKPILRGRDIKRYRTDFADLWLVDTHNGHGNVTAIDIKNYPAIKTHLNQYWAALKKRQDKGKTPYNLRNCAYHEEFGKEKILWLEMSPKPNFTFDSNTIFVLNTAYILAGVNLKFVLAVLNSSVLDSYFPLISTDIRGKTRRYIKQYVENLPIPKISDERQRPFELLVDCVLYTKKNQSKLQSAYFEQLINGMVYELYFPDEIKAAKKEILAHLGDLQPITDEMSDEAKLAIIQAEFERLYDPSHPVRNHLETLDSVEEVRIIQEALKKK